MILEEFAVNPEAIQDWQELNKITMNFGFSNGAVISFFPGRWIKDLQQKANSELNGTLKHQWVIEKLKKIKDEILIKNGRDWNPEYDWIHNSITQHDKKPFYKILHIEGVAGYPEIIGFDLLDETVFEELREGQIKRNAENFAAVSQLLLLNSKNIQLIDPFFSAKNPGFVKSLAAMLKAADAYQRQNIVSIQLHTSYKQSNTEVHIEGEKELLNQHYKRIIPIGQQIEFLWWDDEGTGEIHPRYLITEKGGIRFDRGFVEPAPHEQQEADTDVGMMTSSIVNKITQKYKEDSSSYKVVDKHIVHGERQNGQ